MLGTQKFWSPANVGVHRKSCFLSFGRKLSFGWVPKKVGGQEKLVPKNVGDLTKIAENNLKNRIIFWVPKKVGDPEFLVPKLMWGADENHQKFIRFEKMTFWVGPQKSWGSEKAGPQKCWGPGKLGPQII